jgi:precorrin-2/cobalt-factor-2 C20-methyltransferase
VNTGIFYGIGVGPGDPELLTVKAASVLSACPNVFVPKARIASESVALEIARKYLSPGAKVRELVFPMTPDQKLLEQRWCESAELIAAVLEQRRLLSNLGRSDGVLHLHLFIARTATTLAGT